MTEPSTAMPEDRHQRALERETALVKIQTRGTDAAEVARVTAETGGRVLDATESAMILEITNTPSTVAAFIDRMRAFGVLAVKRSGRVVMPRRDSPVARVVHPRADAAELEHQDATGWSEYLMPVAPTPFHSQADGASDDAAA
jgi:hypothetical protein